MIAATTTPAEAAVSPQKRQQLQIPVADMLETALVKVADQSGNSKIARVMLDTGAQFSLIVKPSFILHLDMPMHRLENPIYLHGLGGTHNNFTATHFTKLTISPIEPHEDSVHLKISPLILDHCNPWLINIPPEFAPSIKHTQDLLADPEILEAKHLFASIILGNSDANIFLHPEFANNETTLLCKNSPFGIVVSGNPRNHTQKHNMKNTSSIYTTVQTDQKKPEIEFINLTNDQALNNEIIQHLRQDRIEVFGDSKQDELDEQKDKLYIEEYKKLITRNKEGRVIAPLPKNTYNYKTLSDNSKIAKNRFKSVQTLLKKHDWAADAYIDMVQSWIKDKVIIETNEEELRLHEHTELPHHGVKRESSTSTKLRVVIDGSAKEKGFASANDYLYEGPNILPELVHIAMRWRTSQYFIIADVSKAFLQIELPEEDSYLLTIRWTDKTGPNQEPKLYRFTRLPWGIICAPFMLNIVVRYLYEKYGEEHTDLIDLMQQISLDTYVDDVLVRANIIAKLIQAAQAATEALAKGKMHLTKFRSFPPHIAHEFERDHDENKPYKVLGIQYQPRSDTCRPGFNNLHAFDTRP
jgi:hypothetical protein